MRNVTKLLTLLLTLAVLVGAMTLTASAAEFSQEDAFAYLDGYADHVGVDENFDENITDIGISCTGRLVENNFVMDY